MPDCSFAGVVVRMLWMRIIQLEVELSAACSDIWQDLGWQLLKLRNLDSVVSHIFFIIRGINTVTP